MTPAVTGGRFKRWAAFRRWFVEKYLTIDARSVGLGRIVVAIVLMIDLVRRIPVLDLFYTNDGLLPNHTLLWRPPTQWMFSFFFLASLRDEAILGFLLCGFVYLALLVGWRTTLMRFLAPICLVSLHARVTLVENGGDWMLCELIIWSAFLPLGRRFSVDAVRESLQRRRETSAAELADRAAMAARPDSSLVDPTGDVNRVVTLAAFTILLQLAISYFFNAIQKGGPTWREGTAVHYVLYQNRMVTWFGVWMRGHMSPVLSRVLSYAALATESVLPLLILSPILRTWTRRAAVLAVIGLHIGFQSFINLGVFSWTMIGYTPFLLTASEWTLFTRLAARSGRRLTLYFDAGCGVCFQIARLLARLDLFERIRFVSSAEVPSSIDLSSELLARTIVVDDESGRRTTRADAVARVLGALPLGLLWAWPLRVPGLRGLANAGYDLFARRRQTISYWLGFAACGVPVAEASVSATTPAAIPAATPALSPRAPIAVWLGRMVAILREGFVLAMLITIVNEALFINQAVPKFLKFDEPGWVKRLVAYPRFIQAWSMFASDAPMSDESVVVEAITADGRRVDPYSEVAGRIPDPGVDEIPSRLDNDSFFFNYSVRIPDQSVYQQAFLEWILRYPLRTGNPGDRIVRFDAYKIENDSPPPGETWSRNVRKQIFLSYPTQHR